MYMPDIAIPSTPPAVSKPDTSAPSSGNCAKPDGSDSQDASFQQLINQKAQDNTAATGQPMVQNPLTDLLSADNAELLQQLAALMLFQPANPAMMQTAPETMQSAATPVAAIPEPVAPSAPLPIDLTGPTELPKSNGVLTVTVAQTPQLQTQAKAVDAPLADVTQNTAQTQLQAEVPVVKVVDTSEQDSPDFSGNTEAQAKPLFQNTDHIPVKVGDSPTLNTESPDFEAQLGKEISKAFSQGDQKVSIRLTPDNLGTIVVELTRSQDGALQVMLHATTSTAANLLQDRSAELSGLLRANTNVPVFVEVQQNNAQAEQQQQQNQQGNARQQQQQQNSQHQQQNQDFLEQLRLGLIPLDAEAS